MILRKHKAFFINNCMNRDSNTIFENYKLVREQTEQNVDKQELSQANDVVQKSNLPENIKRSIQDLLMNDNVVNIYKQVKGLPQGYEKNPDLINLQPGSVSQPGSPSASGFGSSSASPVASTNKAPMRISL